MTTDETVRVHLAWEAGIVESAKDRLGEMTFKNFDADKFASMIQRGSVTDGKQKYATFKFNPDCPVLITSLGDAKTVEDVVDQIVGDFKDVRVDKCELKPSTLDFDTYCKMVFTVKEAV